MKIHSLYFKNGHLGWEVKPIQFQNLNLLVGLSGAGKSQIINALWQIRSIALGNMMNNVEWEIKFSIGENKYEWKGSFAATRFNEEYKIEMERMQASTGLEIERASDGKVKFFRSKHESQPIPFHDTANVLLFKFFNSWEISEVLNHFKMMNLRDHTQSQADVKTDFYNLRFRYASISRELKNELNIKDLEIGGYNIAERLLIAYKKQSEVLTVYDDIVDEVKSIFPEIAEWSIEEQTNANTEGGHIEYKIKINGQKKFIPHWNIASGMLRTFNIIADLYLSDPETVFLLDEFENSLGHNCLPNLEDLILEHALESQFIITSHHPDIINKIPKENWIIIERENGYILNRRADNLPFSNSNHEPYLILTNHFEKQ